MNFPTLLFYTFALLVVAGAVGTVANIRNTVAAAMSLVLTMVSLAGIYVLLGAHLIAVFQIMVYGGAIVVLFLFAAMLHGDEHEELPPGRMRLVKAASVLISICVMAGLVRVLVGFPELPAAPVGFGRARQVGIALYSDYVLLVEMVSQVLLAAIVGALVLAKRKID
jgi:NADH-quinone oxidoreductase subunit J